MYQPKNQKIFKRVRKIKNPTHKEDNIWKVFVSVWNHSILFKINFQKDVVIEKIQIGRIRYDKIPKNNENQAHVVDSFKEKNNKHKTNNWARKSPTILTGVNIISFFPRTKWYAL